MIKYDKYKSSEVDWLGDIPQDWEVKRVKDLLGVFVPQRDKPLLDDNGYPWITMEYLKGDILNLDKIVFSVPKSEIGSKKIRLVPANSVLASCVGEFSITAINLEPVVINQQIQAFTDFKKMNIYFFNYKIQSIIYKQYYNSIASETTLKYLNKDKFLFTPIICPSLNEQTQIANYLDTKTQAIDKKINLLTQKANYYKEYRKSLINEMVCKGLNKNVKSKITELGFNVNTNYNSYRLKDLGYLYSGLSGKAGEDFNQDENPNNKGFIPFTNIANNIYLKKDHLGTVVVYDNENQNKVKKEDVFFLMSSEGYEDIGKSAILDDDLNETYLNSFCKGYRVTNRKANPYFLNYLLLSDNYRKQLTVEGKGFTRINLKMEKVNDFIVFIPNTIDEQNKIVSFLDNKTQTIDKIVSNIHTQIATLKELRKTLINDAVTGKIKVS